MLAVVLEKMKNKYSPTTLNLKNMACVFFYFFRVVQFKLLTGRSSQNQRTYRLMFYFKTDHKLVDLFLLAMIKMSVGVE